MEQSLLYKIISSLSTDALKYFFPGYAARNNDNTALPEQGIDSGICLSKQEWLDSGIRFRITEAKEKTDEQIRFSVRGEKIPMDIPFGDLATEDTLFPEISRKQSPPYIEKTGTEIRRTIRRIIPEPEPVEPDLDPKTKAILDEIEALKEKYGITIEELEAVLAYNVKLSRLRISRHKAIILDDFDRQEVKMDTLTKAVFLLFLKHPEGIRYKDLCDHRRELESIYLSISGRSNLESMRKSISDLTDSVTSNSINEKVSKVKKAFRDVVDERIAKFYYIDGKKGAAKSIALDRSLVIWE